MRDKETNSERAKHGWARGKNRRRNVRGDERNNTKEEKSGIPQRQSTRKGEGKGKQQRMSKLDGSVQGTRRWIIQSKVFPPLFVCLFVKTNLAHDWLTGRYKLRI